MSRPIYQTMWNSNFSNTNSSYPSILFIMTSSSHSHKKSSQSQAETSKPNKSKAASNKCKHQDDNGDDATADDAKMRQKWSAAVYDHFLPEPSVSWNSRSQRWQQVFTCKHNTNTKVHCAFHDNSTANLICHDHACVTDDDDDEPKLIQGNLNAFVQGSTYTARCLHARHHIPHAFVKWEEYHAILCMFNKDIKIFSADTLSCDIKDVYSLIKTWVAKLLQGI
ncbi:hypothetical protein ARMSODRAFT_1022775 [Armillaria solidipes]|uniref:Uncharacterized protein n=1 Tax=Armillaria solidipes TaxID=1076256 RepID=A0A2H3B1P6_9AGAR|nr:hypothetical protein ARMSODRAFT_1022775 [Armillaria solidipes]